MNIYEGKLVSEGIKVGVVCARFNEFIVLAAAEQLGDDELVEPGTHDAHLDALGDQIALVYFHIDFLLVM